MSAQNPETDAWKATVGSIPRDAVMDEINAEGAAWRAAQTEEPDEWQGVVRWQECAGCGFYVGTGTGTRDWRGPCGCTGYQEAWIRERLADGLTQEEAEATVRWYLSADAQRMFRQQGAIWPNGWDSEAWPPKEAVSEPPDASAGGVDLTFNGAWQAHEIARTARLLDGLRMADAQLSRNAAGFWARLPERAEALHGKTLTELFRALAGYAGR